MTFLMENPLVFLADYLVPALIAYLCCLRWGPNRGALYAVGPALILILILFYFQVSPGRNPDGSGRLETGLGYMLDESLFWIASFLVGCAVGSLHWKSRTRRNGPTSK